MIDEIIDSLDTKMYAVDHDMAYKEITSIEHGFSGSPKPFILVMKENKGKTKSLFNDQYFAHSKYTFFDTTLAETTVKMSDWTLVQVFEPEVRRREAIYTISDPKGKILEISNSSFSIEDAIRNENFQIGGICNILKFLKKLSSYPDWTFFEVMKENQELKATLKKLDHEIEAFIERIQEIRKGIE